MNKKIVFAGLIGLAVCLVVIGIVGRARKGARGVKSEADSLYQSALSWQSKGEAVKAVKLYQELIKQFPRDQKAADARYKLGEIYEKEDLWQK
ncbi:unnamed protein product, partial [marine sediment metagenome]